jgi:ribosome-associated protein
VKAISDAVVEGLEKRKIKVWHIEGYSALKWVLLDYVDVVVHVFNGEVRDFYGLERLWGDAPLETLSGEKVESIR